MAIINQLVDGNMVECDECHAELRLVDLVVDKIRGEYNAAFGDYYAVCPKCGEGSFDGGDVYVLSEKTLGMVRDMEIKK